MTAITDRGFRGYLLLGAGAVILAALLVHIAHTTLDFGSPEHDFLIQEWVYDFITASSALITLGVAVVRPQGRLAWALIGIGLLLWAGADTYWTVALAEAEEAPFPSVSDIGYLGGYLFILLGVVELVRMRVRQVSALVWADVAIAALCVAAIGTAILMDFVLANTTGTRLEVAVAVAYPLLDLLALAIAAAAVSVTAWRPGRGLALVSLGMVAAGIGDAVFTHQSLAGTYDPKAWNNSLWPLATVLMAAGALQKPPPRPVSGTPEGWTIFLTPAVFALAILTLLVLENQESGTAAVAMLTTATLAAIVVRLAITFAENRRLVDQLQRDLLTGLSNRGRLFIDLPRALDDGTPHQVAILDLDGFKAYNDAFGHGAGDALLVRLSRRLEEALQGHGRAYRLGGDEFAVLVPGTRAEAHGVMEAASEALTDRGEGFEISSSCGSAEIPSEAHEPVAALELADQRMYAEKDSRRPAVGREVQAVLLRIIQQRAPALRDHGDTVAGLSRRVGERLGIVGGELETLVRAAELHDIGKVAIPDSVLEKPAPLTDEEWDFIRQHTVFGERIISAATSLAPMARVVRFSHERWDGKGYPDGIAGEDIPLAARIIFACDAYDAMTTDRSYASARTSAEALAEIRSNSGTQFDPRVVDALVAVIESGDLGNGRGPAPEAAARHEAAERAPHPVG